MDELEDNLLRAGSRSPVTADNAEAGFARFVELTRRDLDEPAFHAAVAKLVSARLIHDPVRLDQGALQCRWRFELTATGMETVRGLPEGRGV